MRAVHGIPRYTRDIDIFLRPSPDTSDRMLAVSAGRPKDLADLSDLLE